jgi:tetratricopeptide (TPR) repeat protein
MTFNWLNASEAAKIGVALADQFAPQQVPNATTPGTKSTSSRPSELLQEILQRADSDVRGLHLNFYKKAKFANSFKWRLIENGVDKSLADEVTEKLVLHLSGNEATPAPAGNTTGGSADRPQPRDAKHLLAQANKSIAQGAYADAIALYEDIIKLSPRQSTAFNNLGAALSHMGRYEEARGYFHQAIKIKPDFADPHSNIGTVLLLKGQYAEAESFLRHALKLNPRFVDARINLGLALAFLNRLREAKSHFEKALKFEPRNADALVGMALIAKTEGSFDQADAALSRALHINPRMPKALASQAGLRKMTTSDGQWLTAAEDVAESGIAPVDESELRFAIGKYYDDIGDFKHAFQNYKRANDLLKPIAQPYDRDAYIRFVDAMIRVYTREEVAAANRGASDSAKPVFVVGMPRSGTSLTEQIISSHPSAKGAGELAFWSDAAGKHANALANGSLDVATKNKLSETYLQLLEAQTGEALHVVDKAPINADHLGLIHSIFPNARIIYMQRDPIDTCLSCYFQKFVLSLNFTLNLSDLADHYRQHERLMQHWRTVLPAGTILDVPYEELVADQEGWSRKILDFLGLAWDGRVLDFYNTKRSVVTASFWQVRQKMYNNSVRRWRHYEKFIGPLRDLKDLSR